MVAMTLERLAQRVDTSGPETVPGKGPCHLWTMSTNGKGYGQFKADGVVYVAHVWLHTQVYGPIPEGYVRDHVCHNRDKECPGGKDCQHRRCLNLDHIEVIPDAENSRRGQGGYRAGLRMASKEECPQGHPYDAANTRLGVQKLRDGRLSPNRMCRTCRREQRRKRRLARAE